MLSRRIFVLSSIVALAWGVSAATAADNKLPRCYLNVTADGKPWAGS